MNQEESKFITCSKCGGEKKDRITGKCGRCNRIALQREKGFTIREVIGHYKYYLEKKHPHPELFQIIRGIPKTFQHLLDEPLYQKDINASLYLFGPVGEGKTTQAYKLFINQLEWAFLTGSRLPPDIVTVRMIFEQIKASFSSGTMGGWNARTIDILYHYQKVPWLCLDDVAILKTSNWEFQELYGIINYRYEWMLPTVFTSNLSLQEWEESLKDDRLPRRVSDMCKYQKGISNLETKEN